MTTSQDQQLNDKHLGGDCPGDPPADTYRQRILERRLQRETEDESLDKEVKRKIEADDAISHRDNKRIILIAVIIFSIFVTLSGCHIAFNHKNSKVQELGVSLIAAPIAGLFGILGGMALR